MTQTSGYVIANDGVRLHYDEAGAGKAVVLIHGGGLSNVWWERNLPALGRRFHVIAPDTRGCGRSQRTPWGHRTARYAADVREIIHALGLHDVTLVGWSIGARTCYSYLELFGAHRLRGVVLVDETVHITVHEPPPPGSEQQPGESDRDHRRRTMRTMLGPVYGPRATEEEIDRLTDSASGYAPAGETLGADYKAQDWRPLCPAITVPVLVTTGRHSGALPRLPVRRRPHPRRPPGNLRGQRSWAVLLGGGQVQPSRRRLREPPAPDIGPPPRWRTPRGVPIIGTC